jgi:hypothetical protein
MKIKLIAWLFIIGIVCLGTAYADQLSVKSPGIVPEATNVLLNKVTSTGVQQVVDLGATATNFTCACDFSGAAPISVVVYLEGAIYPGVYPAIASQTVTYSDIHSWEFHVTDKPVRYLRGNYVSKVGGDATTAVFMTCTAVQK